MLNLTDTVEFSYATVRYKAPVVTTLFKEGAQLDVEQVTELIAAASSLSNHQPYLLLSDVQGFLTITPAARDLASGKDETRLLKANAVLINNLAIKLVANFFATFNKPPFAFKVFTDRQKAMDWLMKHKHLCQITAGT